MTDRLISTPAPGVLLLVSTAGSVPRVHLHLESRRRFCPDVPLIVHDTGGADDAVMRDLCAAYGALLYTPPARPGPGGADLSAALLAVQSARELGLDLAVLMSDALVPMTNWVPQLQHFALLTQYATYGRPARPGEPGLSPECVAFHAPSWAGESTLRRLEEAVEAGPPPPGGAGEFLHALARDVHAASRCPANAAYESLYPPAPGGDASGAWPWLADGSRRQASLLQPGTDAPLDYHRLATAYGLDYQFPHFARPEDARRDVGTPTTAAPRPTAAPAAPAYTTVFEARVITHEHGDFKSLTGANVLIYLPHGFGDWVQFAAVLPLLDPSNRYFMTRFGDDVCAVMEGCEFAEPLYIGHNPQTAQAPVEHFGLDYGDIDGTVKALTMPLSLSRQCRRLGIDVVYWTSLPDPWGGAPPPYHTKARAQLPHLVPEERLAGVDLSRPLPNPLDLGVSAWLTRWVEARLTARGGFGDRKLCLITRNGYTTIGKNWGHLFRDEVPGRTLREGEECRDFMRLMLRRDPRWMFLIMEDKLYEGDDTVRSADLHAYSYAEVFGPIGGQTPPFGLVLKALVNLAALSVGIPTGPYHLSMVKEGLPTIGLWTQQLPSWYDEPKAESLHLIGRDLRDGGADRLPGSGLERAGSRFRARWLGTRRIPGEDVFEAAEELLA